MVAVTSPCVGLCAIDHATQLCAGCGRTLHEIGNWPRYDESERRAIMATLPARLAALERQAQQEPAR